MYAMEDDLVAAGKFAAAGLDDSQWKTMMLPGNWESKGLPECRWDRLVPQNDHRAGRLGGQRNHPAPRPD